MNKTTSIQFAELQRFLEELGYRHKRAENGEVFFQSRDRMLLYPLYGKRELVDPSDLASTRRFLDAWGQLDAADFDAFLESTTKPA